MIYKQEWKIQNRPAYLGGGNWILRHLNRITVLFGRNGTGKSILLRLARDQNPNETHYVSPERAGDFSANISLAQQQLKVDHRHDDRQGNFSNMFRRQSIARVQTILLKFGAKAFRDPGYHSPIPLGELENTMNEILPQFQFRINPDAEPVVELYRANGKADGEKVANPQQLSSGEAESLTVCLDLLTVAALWAMDDEEVRLILVDEPDMHLHPDLQQQIARFMVRLSERFDVQLIVASHSTTLLAALGHYGGDKVSVVYLSNDTEEQDAVKFDDTLQELASVLGGHALMGPLFSVPLVLVEGDDDYRIWSQVPRNPTSSKLFSVIPCNGDQITRYARSLDRVLYSLLEFRGHYSAYVIRDGDKPIPTNPPLTHVKYIRLACHESENLYLCDEILDTLDLTWEAAKTRIISKSSEYGQKASVLADCVNWDRKTADLKGLMLVLELILDSKRLPWTVRVGRCLSSQRPQGQLAEFLGNELVNALWGSTPQGFD